MADPVVFIVDDDEAVRDSLAALLEAQGFATRTFASGVDFLKELDRSFRGCVLLDVRMPGIDGLAVHEKMIQSGSTLPVIVITGHGDVPLAVRAMKAGAADFIEKPIESRTIVEAIRRALRPRPRPRAVAAPPEIEARLASLTGRERQVLDELVGGAPNKVIAHRLGISPRTVEAHRARVMAKMKAKSLSALVRMAIAAGS